uniref:CSON004345 protein n=1 Tax=Culicoides sonorensis TaxID=179676 RepID=A0A336LX69_CULSO
MIKNHVCYGFEFDADFDSGNLGKVELSKVYNEVVEKTSPDNVIDIEFNLWTKPDCAGTPYENSNRTWFFFSVSGGRPYEVAKFNIMNLNKQAKLFSQGMHPVIRIGPKGKWERIREKPAYFMTNDSFMLTFLHKNNDKPESTKVYYAFTFPYTYTEQQDQLAIYDERYGKDNKDVDRIIIEINAVNTKKNGSSNQTSQCTGKKSVVNCDSKTTEPRLSEEIFSGSNMKQKTIEIYSCDSQTSVTCSLDYLRNNFEIKSTEEILKVQADSSLNPEIVFDENTSESMQQITSLVNNVRIELQQKLPESGLDNIKEEKIEKPSIDLNDEIYYHRELLIRSYEGRRIDLITISSFHGITEKREDRIQHLFPEFLTPRCHVFKDKKIIFISSRVHPGETPASFVLNGFLNFLLEKKNVVAQTLRKMYVFKIVPFLNPDGVFNGLYRSDVLGHNLNRVYLNPNKDTQPSIYAARKLIRYHHFGYDKLEADHEVSQVSTEAHSIDCSTLIENSMTAYSGGDECETNDQPTKRSAKDVLEINCEFMKGMECQPFGTTSKENSLCDLRLFNVPRAKSAPNLLLNVSYLLNTPDQYSLMNHELLKISLNSNSSKISSIDDHVRNQNHLMRLLSFCKPLTSCCRPHDEREMDNYVIKTPLNASDCDENATDLGLFSKQNSSLEGNLYTEDEPYLRGKILPSHDNDLTKTDYRLSKSATQLSFQQNQTINSTFKTLPETQISRPNTSTSTRSHSTKIENSTDSSSKDRVALKNSLNFRGNNSNTAINSRVGSGAVILKKSNDKRDCTSKKGSQERKQGNNSSAAIQPTISSNPPQLTHHFRSHRNDYVTMPKNLNISLDYLTEVDEKGTRYMTEENSDMFLYIDLHGHASKKGVFMYGNHLPTTNEAVECMLLPKLMSLNCHHFHYDGCNFSEKNMYLKGKRDGLSKEGSGRVAIYKMTGLIKAYTLESNYNTGKYVNILPPKGKDIENVVTKTTVAVPPKYTPAIFEEVGRGLGPSILDLTNSNPQPRLHNSEYRTLQGLRNSLRSELERGTSKPRSASKVNYTFSYYTAQRCQELLFRV